MVLLHPFWSLKALAPIYCNCIEVQAHCKRWPARSLNQNLSIPLKESKAYKFRTARTEFIFLAETGKYSHTPTHTQKDQFKISTHMMVLPFQSFCHHCWIWEFPHVNFISHFYLAAWQELWNSSFSEVWQSKTTYIKKYQRGILEMECIRRGSRLYSETRLRLQTQMRVNIY